MATTAIDATQYLAAIRCTVCNIPAGLIYYVVLAALIDVSNGEPVPTDTNELLNEARCLQSCIPPGFVPYAMLAAVSDISTGGGASGVDCGAGAPVAAPASGCGLYIDTTNGDLYKYYSGAWH